MDSYLLLKTVHLVGVVASDPAVDDPAVTVTCCPAAVVSVKPEVDTASTVPAEPPAAAPDRALAPPPAPPPGPGRCAVDDGEAAGAGQAGHGFPLQ